MAGRQVTAAGITLPTVELCAVVHTTNAPSPGLLDPQLVSAQSDTLARIIFFSEQDSRFPDARAQPRFKIVDVQISFMSLQTSKYSGQRRRRERNGEGCPLPQPSRRSGGAS